VLLAGRELLMSPGPELFKTLTEASLSEPENAADRLLGVLVDEFRLAAASLYISTPHADALCLRAQVGFAPQRYKAFELGLDSFPGNAILHRTPVVIQDPAASPLFRDKDLLVDREVAGLVAAPLEFPVKQALESSGATSAPDLVGALCLYPTRHADLRTVEQWMRAYSNFLGCVYGTILDRRAMRFRRETVDRVAFKGDIGSLAHSFLKLIQEDLSVEAASLWTVDTRRHLLYLQRSTALAHVKREVEIPAIPIADPGIIARCFESGEPVLHTPRDPVLDPEHIVERINRPLRDALLIPVPLPSHAKLRTERIRSAGLLTLINRSKRFDSVEHLASFSWEDAFLSSFACEVISVLLYQMIRSGDHESDYERLMHGARTSVQSAKSTLKQLEEHDVDLPAAIDSPNLIPNAIDWLEDLENQMNREELVKAGDLDIRSTALYGEVLAKLRPMVARMRTRARNPTFSITGIDELAGTFRQLPRVLADPRALDCVFRNLIDNSMKYARTDPRTEAVVEISTTASADDSAVTVTVTDNGIGIPEEEAELIFENGFRGKRASGRQPQGVGRGLFECRMLLELMNGDIDLVAGKDGACFAVTLKTAKGRRVL
jgi:hypothetical protein